MLRSIRAGSRSHTRDSPTPEATALAAAAAASRSGADDPNPTKIGEAHVGRPMEAHAALQLSTNRATDGSRALTFGIDEAKRVI